MNKQLIFFGEDWGGLPSSSQHLATHLLKLGWQIVWINSIGLRQPKLKMKDFKRLAVKLMSFLSKKTSVRQLEKNEKLSIVSPLIIPYIGFSFIDKINRFLFKRQLDKVIKSRNLLNYQIITALPTAIAFYPLLSKQPWYYYCCDDFSALANVSHKAVTKCENRLVTIVECIFVSSQVLADKFENYHPILVEHGVDVELFQSSRHRPSDLIYSDAIIGFYGSISEWLDIELLVFCASDNPDFSFVFIGNINTDIKGLVKLPNVHFLGSKKHSELSNYLHHWQVSILPFRCNQQIEGCNPLKLREYLASGSYVVSTDFPEAQNFSQYICIADTKEAFSEGIRRYINDTKQAKLQRKKAASIFSWQKQTEIMERILLKYQRSL